MSWEILREGLKSKIEIKYPDICALKITCPKDLPRTLDIMLRERVYVTYSSNYHVNMCNCNYLWHMDDFQNNRNYVKDIWPILDVTLGKILFLANLVEALPV